MGPNGDSEVEHERRASSSKKLREHDAEMVIEDARLPRGSGKSTLAKVLIGDSAYEEPKLSICSLLAGDHWKCQAG